MKRYHMEGLIGEGTFSRVVKATNTSTDKVVAIKIMKKKFPSWEECVKLREVLSLKKLTHPNIVKLKEVIRDNDDLHFVFEHMERNLLEMIKAREGEHLPEKTIQKYMFQTIAALKHTHKHGFFHRDLKPENLLLAAEDNCKLADFGLAREIRSRPPFTEYVSTRWYRAPEVLLRTQNYNSPIDMWAVGCIMAELYTFKPLFPGTTETDQLARICNVLGTPTMKTWETGIQLANEHPKFNWPPDKKVDVMQQLKKRIPNASEAALELIRDLLSYNPTDRPQAGQALSHHYFQDHRSQPLVLEELNKEGSENGGTRSPMAAKHKNSPSPGPGFENMPNNHNNKPKEKERFLSSNKIQPHTKSFSRIPEARQSKVKDRSGSLLDSKRPTAFRAAGERHI